jgi:hypothetical protein
LTRCPNGQPCNRTTIPCEPLCIAARVGPIANGSRRKGEWQICFAPTLRFATILVQRSTSQWACTRPICENIRTCLDACSSGTKSRGSTLCAIGLVRFELTPLVATTVGGMAAVRIRSALFSGYQLTPRALRTRSGLVGTFATLTCLHDSVSTCNCKRSDFVRTTRRTELAVNRGAHFGFSVLGIKLFYIIIQDKSVVHDSTCVAFSVFEGVRCPKIVTFSEGIESNKR